MNRAGLISTQQGDAFGQRAVDGYEGYNDILSASASNIRSRILERETKHQTQAHTKIKA